MSLSSSPPVVSTGRRKCQLSAGRVTTLRAPDAGSRLNDPDEDMNPGSLQEALDRTPRGDLHGGASGVSQACAPALTHAAPSEDEAFPDRPRSWPGSDAIGSKLSITLQKEGLLSAASIRSGRAPLDASGSTSCSHDDWLGRPLPWLVARSTGASFDPADVRHALTLLDNSGTRYEHHRG